MDSGPRRLEDMRHLFEAGCDAARNDLERIEHMLARMDRIEAMLDADADADRAGGDRTAPSPPAPAPERVRSADVKVTGGGPSDDQAALAAATGVVGAEAPAEGPETQAQADRRETQAREIPAATERRGGRASLRDSPLAHLFRPTE